jgi:hypothetical protein
VGNFVSKQPIGNIFEHRISGELQGKPPLSSHHTCRSLVSAANMPLLSIYAGAVSKVKKQNSPPNNILFFLNPSVLCEFFVFFVLKNQSATWRTQRVHKGHYGKI